VHHLILVVVVVVAVVVRTIIIIILIIEGTVRFCLPLGDGSIRVGSRSRSTSTSTGSSSSSSSSRRKVFVIGQVGPRLAGNDRFAPLSAILNFGNFTD
jgi:hypothetical protein